ncbi:REP-associated tyrosine transposase [Kaarinaea lacus]
MPQYRRANTPGATYFFTLITYRRQTILCDALIREDLREAILAVSNTRPFVVDAWVLLPDHLHCIWTLPVNDANFSQRWALIKRKVSVKC